MTDPIAALSILIEFSVGLAGFSGIVIIFAATPAGWNEADKYRISNLLCCSLCAGLIGFIPIGLLHSTLDPQVVWGVSSIFLGCGCILVLTIILGRKSQMPEDQKKVLNPFLVVTLTGGIILNVPIQFANALNLLPGNRFIYLYFGLVWLLIVAGIQFYRVIFYRRMTDDGAGSSRVKKILRK
jgi:hypothetical protein